MTAEVAIMNPQGIALAADSAVTLGADKTITGIEWETIIKSCFREMERK